MTRRNLLASFLLILASVASFPAAARPAEKAGPLEVTYYYLPG